jgi:tetratricopeptide (TPR) repeat protein
VLALAADLDRDWVQPLVQRGRILERRAYIARYMTPGEVAARRNLYEAGLKMAARAAQRDPNHAAVHALKGLILHHIASLPGLPPDSVTSSREAAEAALTRAADLDPSNQSVWRLLAELLNTTGRHGEALVAAETGYRIDPYGPDVRSLTHHLFTALFEMGADREAHGWCSQGATDYEGDLVFLYCTLALHAWGDAIEPRPDLMRRELMTFQERDRRSQPYLLPRFETMIAAAYARAGQADSARAILRRVAEASDDDGVLWMRASVHALLHEDSVALELLEQYLDIGGLDAPRVLMKRPFWHLRERTELHRLIEGRHPDRVSRNP